MTFVAPEKPVELNLIVKDQLGDEVIVPIRVFNSTKAAEAAAPLTVTPRKIVVYEGGAAKFNVTGGAPGYRPRLSSNLGSVSENPFLYKAPMETGKTELIIEDTEANIATVPIEVLPVPKPDKKLVIYNLEFLFDQSKLTPPSIDTLKSNIKLIKSLNVKRIIVAGHTDNIGTVDYNLALSRERAEVVAEVLATILKFEPSKVQAIGYGKSKPIVSNDTEKGRQHNRRVELYLYKN
jgi:outer membrane protein OmpA-like peptidoglycan-associated protein